MPALDCRRACICKCLVTVLCSLSRARPLHLMVSICRLVAVALGRCVWVCVPSSLCLLSLFSSLHSDLCARCRACPLSLSLSLSNTRCLLVCAVCWLVICSIAVCSLIASLWSGVPSVCVDCAVCVSVSLCVSLCLSVFLCVSLWVGS